MKKLLRKINGLVLMVSCVTGMLSPVGFAADPSVKKDAVWKDQTEKSMNWRAVLTLSGAAAFGDSVGLQNLFPLPIRSKTNFLIIHPLDPINPNFYSVSSWGQSIY